MTPARIKRLYSDYEEVKKNFAGHKNIIVTPIGEEPPEKYHVTYFVNGIYLLPDGSIETLGRHEVEISRPNIRDISRFVPYKLRFGTRISGTARSASATFGARANR